MKPYSLPAGHDACQEGDECDTMWLLTEGTDCPVFGLSVAPKCWCKRAWAVIGVILCVCVCVSVSVSVCVSVCVSVSAWLTMHHYSSLLLLHCYPVYDCMPLTLEL